MRFLHLNCTDSQLLSIKSNPESITEDQFYNISYPGLDGVIEEFQNGEVNLENDINKINQNLINGINIVRNVDINTSKTFSPQTRKSKNLQGETTLQAVTNAGAVTNNDLTLNGANLIFEGYLENAYETTLSVVEPTGDRLITLPDSDGQVAMDGDALAYSIVFGS